MDAVLITGARAPVALHLARLLKTAGHTIVLADTLATPMAHVSNCATYRQLPSPRFQTSAYEAAVRQLIDEAHIDVVIPTCEEVFYLAHIWQTQAPPARLLAPPAHLLADVHHKFTFIQKVQDLGLDAPGTRLLQTQSDLKAVSPTARQMVFKPVWSRFANAVVIRPTPARAAQLEVSAKAPWVAQDFVAGREISAFAVARAGAVKALTLYVTPFRAGPGAGVCFEQREAPQAADFVKRFVQGVNWDGLISFDLIQEPSGRVLPLECNPRPTSGLHFFDDGPGFAQMLLNAGPSIAPSADGILGLPLALWIYGLPQAVRQAQVGAFVRTLRRMSNILDWPNDPAPARGQWRALAEIAQIAWREKISLQAAATRDIEWNGPDQSSI